MNYDKLLMKIGGFGRFQKRMLALLMIPPFLDPMTSYMLTFILGDHKHRCQMPNTMGDPFNSTLNMAANISECFVYQNGSTTACNEWVYDQSQYKSTLISTFDMVCDNKFVRSHTMLCHYIGIFCGAFTYGMFSDTFQKESPRWLIAKRKLSRAEMILKDIAKENNANFDIDIQKIKVDETQERVAFCTAVGELFKFSISMTYFGITMKVGNLGGDVYVNYLISTSAEVIALFICLYVVERLGRKKIFSASMLICGIGCLCTIFSSLYGGPSLHWLTITLAMIGKLTITVAYFNIYLMVAENFPTNLRSFAIGICSSSGYAGSMVSAYVGDLGVLVDTKFGVALPLVIFGAFGICAGLLSFALPETKNMPLPQSIQEAENISRKQYKDGGSVLLGRQPVLTTALIGMMLPNLIRSFVSSLPLVGFLIFANGYFSMLVYDTGYILATELVDSSKRVFANFAYYFSFCIGEYVLVILAYFIRDWRILGWSTSIVVGIFLTSLLFQKESARWLIAKGKLSRAEMILKDIAKENNANFDIDIQKIKVDEKHEKVAFCTVVGELFKSKILTFRLAIFMFNWFSISMTYFGITMKVGNLGGDVYVNYLISTSAEVIALFICLYVVERLGRKKIFSSSMLICGTGCLCTIFSSLYGVPSLHWLTITLAMIGKLTITVAYFNIYLMVAENFPTNLRSFALGIGSSAGYAGSMVSAYVGDLVNICY
ncbi:OCTN [Mytilus edulis]|uniref:SLC22A4_5 n=1 Tax=Mytilus edulis TaxID=6550 RepID=A0A8S3PTY5_MYTED|nr:OCTN [Mytilus edulis]